MTRPFLQDYNLRRRQVKRYLAMVSCTERAIRLSGGSQLSLDRLHLLRAGTYLILYNLVEASARGALDAIHEAMNAERISFAALSPTLRREVVKGFKRNADPEKQSAITDIQIDIVSMSLNAGYHFSGNVDAKLIRSIASLYGFSADTDKTLTRSGADLVIIKSTRNDLAHGDKTYDEVGRNVTARNLLELALRATNYIETILYNVDEYLNIKGYSAAA